MMFQSRKYMITIGTQSLLPKPVKFHNGQTTEISSELSDTTWHMLSLSITGRPVV